MNIEYEYKISNPDVLLVLEINERVKIAIQALNQDISLSDIDISVLKEDQTSLNEISNGHLRDLKSNLSRKIDIILKSVDKD